MSEKIKEVHVENETNGDDKIQVERAKMNIIYVGIASVVMFFGGMTSAYIVSMGDAFWIKFPLPTAFWASTAIIATSSVVLQLTIAAVRKGNIKGLKIGAVTTLLLGFGFVYTQFQGYSQLAEKGSHMTGSGIIISDGKYDAYFAVKQGKEFIVVDGNDYIKLGKVLTKSEMESLKKYMKQFLKPDLKKNFKVKNDGIHTLYWENQEMNVVDGELITNDTLKMESVDRVRLSYLARNIQDGRGDFFMKGKFGKDFHVFYKGVEMGYKNGGLTYKGKQLDVYLQVKAVESADTASSFLWAITIAHLLHIIATLLYMVRIVRFSFSGKINQENNVRLRMGAVFWHFLGLLWIFLLLFLLFIH